MVRMIRAVLPADREAWVFNQNNTCRECGTVYRIERSDKRLRGWWHRFLEVFGHFGCFPKSRYTNHGNGPVLELPFMVCDEIQGIPGPWVLTRCINCHSYCYTAKETTNDHE